MYKFKGDFLMSKSGNIQIDERPERERTMENLSNFPILSGRYSGIRHWDFK